MISIALVTVLAMAAAPPAGGPPRQPRLAYSACLQKVIKAKAGDKLDAAAFEAAAKASCSTEESAFTKSVIDYDVSAGTRRPDAEEGARLQVEDYLATAKEAYAINITPN